ncbi:hypothetical protein GWI33_007333 [Rhynchophorus ferrugineus]|uniref:Uncharacterized protein n=1 Tax=Rhynchophorus ferrugineus TaxID=354439 RepID=A0A834MEY0_RHYFE|nr:hypothetical protein GWI33_007333 [Rhynchophorus ferrugineus]
MKSAHNLRSRQSKNAAKQLQSMADADPPRSTHELTVRGDPHPGRRPGGVPLNPVAGPGAISVRVRRYHSIQNVLGWGFENRSSENRNSILLSRTSTSQKELNLMNMLDDLF